MSKAPASSAKPIQKERAKETEAKMEESNAKEAKPKAGAKAAKTDDTKAAAPKAAEKAAPKKVTAAKAEKPAKSAKATPKGTAIEKPKPGSKPNALQQPLQPSEALAAVVGAGTMARGEVVSKVWEYIKANKLQNPDDGREILADEKLEKVFGRPKVTMFEMNKYLAQHLS